MANLDDLNASVGSLLDIQTLDCTTAQIRETEGSIASLIEALDKGDIEAGHDITDAHIHVGVRPRVRAGEN
jgi:hypothetical protein